MPSMQVYFHFRIMCPMGISKALANGSGFSNVVIDHRIQSSSLLFGV